MDFCKFHKILPSYEAEPYIIQFTGCGMFMSAAYKVNGEEKLNLMIVSDAIPADAKHGGRDDNGDRDRGLQGH